MMKVRHRRYSLSFLRPFETAAGILRRRTGFLIRIEDDGFTGIGEAAPLSGWTESFADCRRALSEAAGIARDDGPAAALENLSEFPAARYGLQMALVDLRARKIDKPMAAYLTGMADPRADTEKTSFAPDRLTGIQSGDHLQAIPVNATVDDGTVAATVSATKLAVDAGFSCVKIKVGARPLAKDINRLRAVRQSVGENPRLRVDANGVWNRDTAAEAVSAFSTIPIQTLEQPLPGDDLKGHAGLRNRGLEIALDETIASQSLARVVDCDAADVVVIKPMALGGLDRALSIVHTARRQGVDVILSNLLCSVVGRITGVHLAAAVRVQRACGLATGNRWEEDIAAAPATEAEGMLPVPREPGHGVNQSTAWAAGTAVNGDT